MTVVVAAGAAAGVLGWATRVAAGPLLRGSAGLEELLTALAAALAWTVVLWVAAVVVLTAAAELPGRVGAVFALVAARCAPAVARRWAAAALGVSIAVSPLAVLPAVGSVGNAALSGGSLPDVGRPVAAAVEPGPSRHAGTGTAASSGVAPQESTGPDAGRGDDGSGRAKAGASGSGSQPTTSSATAEATPPRTPTSAATDAADRPGVSGPAPSGPTAPAAGSPRDGGWTPAVPAPSPGQATVTSPPVGLVTSVPGAAESVTDEVVVRRGDTLWGIAARALGPRATIVEIAAAWPTWYAANRDVIGADPDLILPGTILRPPAPAHAVAPAP